MKQFRAKLPGKNTRLIFLLKKVTYLEKKEKSKEKIFTCGLQFNSLRRRALKSKFGSDSGIVPTYYARRRLTNACFRGSVKGACIHFVGPKPAIILHDNNNDTVITLIKYNKIKDRNVKNELKFCTES